MEKSDVKEIRKVVKAKETVIDWVYGLYVSADNEIVWENVNRLSDLDEAERFRHMNMFSKVLSPHLGRDSFPMLIADQQELLLTLRQEKRQIEDFQEFRDLLLETYLHTDPYYATLTRIIYDVPTKTKDKQKLDDSEFVYEAVLFSICPAKLSSPALGLKDDKVTELERRWTIGNPKSGFLYPAFDGRLEDRNEVLIHSNEPDNEEFFQLLFQPADGIQPVGAKEQKNIFSDLLSNLGVTIEDAAAIGEAVVEHASDEDCSDTLEARDIKKIVEDCGVRNENFDEIFESTVGDAKLNVDAVVEKNAIVKTDNAVLKMSVEDAQSLKVQTIDGISYIMIPVNGQILVGNTRISAGQILAENKGNLDGTLKEAISGEAPKAEELPETEEEAEEEFLSDETPEVDDFVNSLLGEE